MNRFLTFFLVSFLLHLAVGAVLISRTGILGGKGEAQTELTEAEELPEENKAQTESEPKSLNQKEPLEIKVQEKKSPIKAQKKPRTARKKKAQAKKAPIKKAPPKKAPPKKEEPISETPALKKNEKKSEKLSLEKSSPAEEKSPAPDLNKTPAPAENTEDKAEWVDEEELEKAPAPVSQKTESPEPKPPESKPPESKPLEEKEAEAAPKPLEKDSAPAQAPPAGKSSIPPLEISSFRSHEQLKQLKGNPLPVYPKEALKKKWEGRVEIFYYVNPGGFVEKIQLKNSSGHSALDNSALRALARYRYRPGQQGWVSHPVEFFLETDKEIIETAPLGERSPSTKK